MRPDRPDPATSSDAMPYVRPNRTRRLGRGAGAPDAPGRSAGRGGRCGAARPITAVTGQATNRSCGVVENPWRSSHSSASFAARRLSRHCTTRPPFHRSMSPAASRMRRCLLKPVSDMAKGCANSPTERWPCRSRMSTARRVPSASAAKMASSRRFGRRTMRFSVDAAAGACQVRVLHCGSPVVCQDEGARRETAVSSRRTAPRRGSAEHHGPTILHCHIDKRGALAADPTALRNASRRFDPLRPPPQ